MKHWRKNLGRWSAIGLVMALLLTACGSGTVTDNGVTVTDNGGTVTDNGGTVAEVEVEPVPVSFGGSVTWYGQLPVMVAAENGYFETLSARFDPSPVFFH